MWSEEFGENRPGLVGLFADQDIDEVNEIIEECGLDYAQLCGSEKPDYWEQVRAKVIRQTKVKTLGSQQETVDAALAQIQEVASHGNIPQLDSYKEGAFGGTGHAFDWDVAARIAQEHDVVLAGGLTPTTSRPPFGRWTHGWSTSPPASRPTASKTTPRFGLSPRPSNRHQRTTARVLGIN